jgi:uncharacterized protein
LPTDGQQSKESTAETQQITVSGATPLSTPPDRGIEWMFWGPNRLRAGWAILAFAVIFIILAFADAAVIRSVFHLTSVPQNESPKVAIVIESTQVLCVFLATLVMSWIDRRPVLSYGYQGSKRFFRLLCGLAWGFVAISCFVILLWKLGYLAFDGVTLHGLAVWKYAALWGMAFLFTGFFEESLMRGYMQYTMTRGVGFWWGALLFSFLFGFSHGANEGETMVGLFSAGAIGLVFCISLWYTGSLWWAVGFHAAWDWGESYFFGTSDSGLVAQGHLLSEHPVGKILWSGGATGPEGSLLILPLVAVIAIAMFAWWGPRAQPPFAGSGWTPAWARQRRLQR